MSQKLVKFVVTFMAKKWVLVTFDLTKVIFEVGFLAFCPLFLTICPLLKTKVARLKAPIYKGLRAFLPTFPLFLLI